MKFKIGEIVRIINPIGGSKPECKNGIVKIIAYRNKIETPTGGEYLTDYPYEIKFLDDVHKYLNNGEYINLMFSDDELERVTEDEAFVWSI